MFSLCFCRQHTRHTSLCRSVKGAAAKTSHPCKMSIRATMMRQAAMARYGSPLGWNLNTSTTTDFPKHYSMVGEDLCPESFVLIATSPTQRPSLDSQKQSNIPSPHSRFISKRIPIMPLVSHPPLQSFLAEDSAPLAHVRRR